MRKLLVFTLGVGTACCLGSMFFWGKALLPITVYCLASGLLFLVFGKKNRLFRYPSVLLLGAAAGFLWFSVFQSQYIEPVSQMDGTKQQLSVIVTEYPEKGTYGMNVDGYIMHNGLPYKIRVYLKGTPTLVPGDRLEADFNVRLTTPGGKKDSEYYQSNGIFLLGSQKSDGNVLKSNKTPLWLLPTEFAHRLKCSLESVFPSDTIGFAKALLLGDSSGLSYSQDTSLKIAGLRHMIAISGLHVSILFGAIMFLFRGRRWLTFLVSLPTLLFFASMTGFTPSVTRACLMSILMALGSAVFEEYDKLTSLAFACLIMMGVNPLVIYSVSFQLSVASCLGILLFAEPIYRWVLSAFPKVRLKSRAGAVVNWFAVSVSISLSSMLTATPLCAWYFGTISLVGVVANLLVIWVIPFVFCGIAAAGIMGLFWNTFGAAAAWTVSWPIRYVLYAAGLFAKIPYAAVYTQSQYIVYWLVAVYVLVVLLMLLHGRYFQRIFIAGFAGLVAAIVISALVPRRDAFRLTVLDVGEGQCILIQSNQQYFMVDCGGDSDALTADRIAQTLLSQGIFHLDGIALTHYDRDHTGSLQNLLTRISTDRLYLPDLEERKKALMLSSVQGAVIISSNTEFAFGNGIITLYAPQNQKSSNENCMCVLFESPECVILITGDRGFSGEKALIQGNYLPDVDILIAGHHGSKNSTSTDLLQAVRPETVIISVGVNNTYGHPSKEVLDRIAGQGCTVYRTDLQGSVLVRR